MTDAELHKIATSIRAADPKRLDRAQATGDILAEGCKFC